MLTFAFMDYPCLVCILFGMPSLHPFTFLFSCFYTFLVLISVTTRPKLVQEEFSQVYESEPQLQDLTL